MSDNKPLATHQFEPGKVDETLEFLKRTRNELRMLRKVRVFVDRLQVFDVNGDLFEIQGVGYPDDEIVPLLDAVNTAYKRELIHQEIDGEYKEF